MTFHGAAAVFSAFVQQLSVPYLGIYIANFSGLPTDSAKVILARNRKHESERFWGMRPDGASAQIYARSNREGLAAALPEHVGPNYLQ